MIRSTNDLLRELPSIDSLLRTTTALSLQPLIGAEHLGALARRIADELRHEILADSKVERSFAARDGSFSRDSLLEEAERRLAAIHQQESIRGLSRVINATGVILHTNLGRAPLCDAARSAMLEAAGYCNLEFDLATGTRGRRSSRGSRTADGPRRPRPLRGILAPSRSPRRSLSPGRRYASPRARRKTSFR